jgi:hypothetical protein
MEVVLVVGVIAAALILRMIAVIRLRNRLMAPPPAHPAARRNAALSRAAVDQDWDWPR